MNRGRIVFSSKSWRIAEIAAGLVVAGAVFISCSTLPRTVFAPPQIPGAHYAGNRACFECHTNYVRRFAASPHARVKFSPESRALSPESDESERLKTQDSRLKTDLGCESCHGPGSKHIEVGGGRGKFIVNPGKEPTACFQCHVSTEGEFKLPQHHPVPEGRMNCVQCHDPHGADVRKPAGGLAMARQDQSCAQCHREQTRPFVFEHEALREGCIVCHPPHGSVNRKLLVANDPNLCLRCHAQRPAASVASGGIFIGKVDHTALLRQGTCWSAGCHTAIHGSNVDPRMRF